MKLHHLVHGRPIGPTFCAYLEQPKLVPEEYDMYGTWTEETTLEDLAKRFIEHVEYAREHFPETYFPYTLEIRVRMGDK